VRSFKLDMGILKNLSVSLNANLTGGFTIQMFTLQLTEKLTKGCFAPFFLFFTIIFLSSCNPLASGGTSAGMCRTVGGSQVNTYTLFGSWKKITGYESSRSAAELELNYDVLLIEAGEVFCVVEVINGAVGDKLAEGTYAHNVAQKSATFTILAGFGQGSNTATYSFTGTCDKTQMTLAYGGGEVERYRVLSKDAVSCASE
jgi:hypothetical protein